MTALTELLPRVVKGKAACFEELIFLCPKCRQHEISVAFWALQPKLLQIGLMGNGEPDIRKLWHVEGDGFHDISLTPSINREGLGDKCGGWHGHITDGGAAP
jgi:hypothetical protein